MENLTNLLNEIAEEKDNKIIPENIRNGVEVFGITGTLQQTEEVPIATTAVAGKIKVGEGFYMDENNHLQFTDLLKNLLTMTGTEINSLPATYSGNILCSEEYGNYKTAYLYIFQEGEIIKELPLSGGGGQVNTNRTQTISDLEQNIAIGKSLILHFDYQSAIMR